jgi:hypothetical protein
MAKPLFVKTSKGYINLALVQMVQIQRGRDTVEISFCGEDGINISTEEWHHIISKVGEVFVE